MCYTQSLPILSNAAQQHPGIKTTVNPAEDNHKTQCKPNETDPNFNAIHPRKRHIQQSYTYLRAGPPAFALLHELAELAASTGAVSQKLFMESAMRNLSTTLCRGIARQVLASALLRARLDGRPVFHGRPVPTDGLA